jgi:hypothetical protein
MARLKTSKIYKCKLIAFRCTEEDFNEIKIKANIYTEGNVSEYILYTALNYEVNYDDLEAPELDEIIKQSAKAKHTNFTKRK